MRLLADECVDARILAALEEAGHEVECPPLPLGAVDLDVAAAAETLNLPLLTQDLDFGELGVVYGRPSSWVVILRDLPEERAAVTRRLLDHLAHHADRTAGRLTLIDAAGVRERSLGALAADG